MRLTNRAAELIFWAFCLVVFSKISWYDLRVYFPAEMRRNFQTTAFTIWILAQLLVYLPVAGSLFKHNLRPVAILTALVVPYFLVGLFRGQFNQYLINDIARYALPFGYLLFAMWAVRTLSLKTILQAMAVSIALMIILRLGLHIALSGEKVMRYGIHWEVYLPCTLIASSFAARKWHYFILLVSLLIVGTIFYWGLTRALLLGTMMSAAILGIAAILWWMRSRTGAIKLGLAACFAFAGCLAPAMLAKKARLNITMAYEHSIQSISDIQHASQKPVSVSHESAAEHTAADTQTQRTKSNIKPVSKSELDSNSPVTPNLDKTAFGQLFSEQDNHDVDEYKRAKVSALNEAQNQNLNMEKTSLSAKSTNNGSQTEPVRLSKKQWIVAVDNAMKGRGLGVGTRVAESRYFLDLASESWKTLLFGAGAGQWEKIPLPDNAVRIVRGPHVTYVNFIYRHGILFGLPLALFLAFYGMRRNLQTAWTTDSSDKSILLLSLESYRISALAMAVLHQGLLDDPIIFFAIAMAAYHKPDYDGAFPGDQSMRVEQTNSEAY